MCQTEIAVRIGDDEFAGHLCSVCHNRVLSVNYTKIIYCNAQCLNVYIFGHIYNEVQITQYIQTHHTVVLFTAAAGIRKLLTKLTNKTATCC